MSKKKKNCYDKLLGELKAIENNLDKLDDLIVKLRDHHYPDEAEKSKESKAAYEAICKLFLEARQNASSEGEA